MYIREMLATLLLLGSLGTASAISYLPLAEGTISHLSGTNDSANSLIIIVVENFGSYATLYFHEEGGNDWDTWLRMSQDPDGSTYLLAQSFDGGASRNETADPVLWIDTPLTVGHTWSLSTLLGENT